MPVLNHTHSYVLYKGNQYKRNDLFKCNDPHCHHYAERAMIIGKASLCPKCKRNELVLTRDDLRRASPLCNDCANHKRARETRLIKSLVNSIGTEPLDLLMDAPQELPNPDSEEL